MGITSGNEFFVLGESYVAASVTVGTSQTPLRAGATNLANRETIIIYNNNTSNIYIGPTGVTTATGLKIVPGQMMTLNAGENITVYAITISGTANVVVQELA